jgi:hypothetical protein
MYKSLVHAGFLLGLLFSPEDRGDMFLQNAGRLSTDYTASQRAELLKKYFNRRLPKYLIH